MEKTFALGVSGLVATVVTAVPIFAQADVLNFLGLAERLGLGVVIAMFGYKIIVKMIEEFSTAYIAKLNVHDTETREKLAIMSEKIDRIEGSISSAVWKNDKQ